MQTGDRAGLHEKVGKLKSGLIVSPEVAAAWETARSSPDFAYLCCQLDPSVKDSVLLHSSGNGFASLTASLKDSDITFVVASAKVDGRPKHFFFTWVGPSVSIIKKGKVSLTKGAVYNTFEGLCAEFMFNTRDELEPDTVRQRLAKALGVGVEGTLLS